MNENQLILRPEQAAIQISDNRSVQFRTLGDIAMYATILHDSGLLPKEMSPRQATGNIIAGMGIGLTPWQSILCMANVNNRPTVYGDALIGIVLASGLLVNQKTEYFKDKSGAVIACQYTCWRKGMEEPVTGEFTMDMARAAGLMGHTGWKSYPRRMLKMRARAFALRDAFADILGGIRIREEEEDAIEVEATIVQPEAPKAKKTMGEMLARANKGRPKKSETVIDVGEAEIVAQPQPADEEHDDGVGSQDDSPEVPSAEEMFGM